MFRGGFLRDVKPENCSARLAQCWNDNFRLYPRWLKACVAVKLAAANAREKNGIALLKAK